MILILFCNDSYFNNSKTCIAFLRFNCCVKFFELNSLTFALNQEKYLQDGQIKRKSNNYYWCS